MRTIKLLLIKNIITIETTIRMGIILILTIIVMILILIKTIKRKQK